MARMVFFDERVWHNWHQTVENVPIAGRFELHNGDGDETLANLAEAGTAIKQLLERAFLERRRLRAQGAAWSFSEAAAVPGGYVLATGYANWLFPIPTSHIHEQYSGDRGGLVLCQTGISVAELNMFLERQLNRSLATSGASNGQTLVGAMSTGTHGSAVDQPAIQGQIVGLQLLPAPDRNLWLERASNPVTDGRIAAQLGATVIRHDELFDAVLVGLGAFGVIHSVVVKTVPRFLIETYRKRLPLDAGIRTAMKGGGFADADLPGLGDRPYFFQSVVNDHIDPGAAYVTVSYKRPWVADHQLTYDIVNKRAAGYNLAVVVGNLVERFPGVTPQITKAVLADQLSPINAKVGSWGQSFNFTTPRAGVAGASVSVRVEETLDALSVLQRALGTMGGAPVVFACRYVARSPGLLAFTRYPSNVVIDIDGLDTRTARRFMAEGIKALRAAGIDHAEHWGKINQLTPASIEQSYGPDLIRWKRIRRETLGETGRYVFGSDFLDRIGLTTNAP